MKNPFKKKRGPVPRSQAAIMEDFNKASLRLGQVNYQISRFQKEIQQINQHIDGINNEMAARLELDKQSPPANLKETPTTQQGAQ